jgi:hypothetical protein
MCSLLHSCKPQNVHVLLSVQLITFVFLGVFVSHICAYAVMSHHVHLVLHVDKALGWSDKQVLSLWHTLYKGTLLTQKFMRDDILNKGELITLHEIIARYRRRLYENLHEPT